MSVFAGPLSGSSAPDSIAVVGPDVFVGYGNGGAPDGSGGAMSTIAEYSSTGSLLATLTVTGHNDGLRLDPYTGQLWAVQNEDGNPNLVLINPKTLTMSAPYSFSATPHGGGYDDVAFNSTGTYISASNPLNNPNTAPAIVSAKLSGGVVDVTGAVFANATATVLNPGGGTTTLNLQDPDSMIFAPNGQLVLDSQSDHQLVFVNGVGTQGQSVSVLNLADEVDDTVFGTGALQRLLVADTKAGVIYSVVGHFAAGTGTSAADALGEVVGVNLSTGAFTPIVSGLDAPHGEAFFNIGVPEPGSWALMLLGCGLAGGAMRQRRLPAGARAS
ncbi:MAG: PEPxxWA-CTERM sorting domain-containing protein [Caulobacteraceae bacterium]|nr:PEPxxWA-CTERM sorting domain-containing protein [Caulobacteraceae bacterium]